MMQNIDISLTGPARADLLPQGTIRVSCGDGGVLSFSAHPEFAAILAGKTVPNRAERRRAQR